MFDDAQNIISKEVIEMANDIGTKNTVQDIHLYVFNGVYVPQSYILNQLYEQMMNMEHADFRKTRNLSQGTVRVQIYPYSVGSKYPGNTLKDWQNESANA